MSTKYSLKVDNRRISANKGDLLLFTLFENEIFTQGESKTRRRGGFCGMGICQECLVKIENGEKLACQTIVEKDMEVTTDE